MENIDLMFKKLKVHLSTAVTSGALQITQPSKKTAKTDSYSVFPASHRLSLKRTIEENAVI